MSILTRWRERRRARAAGEPRDGAQFVIDAELLLRRFVEAESAEAKRDALEPIMLTERYDIWLGQYIREYWFAGAPEEFVQGMEHHRMVLRYISSETTDTVDEALADVVGEPPPPELAEKFAQLDEIGSRPDSRLDAELVDAALAIAMDIDSDPWLARAPLFVRCSVTQEIGTWQRYRWRRRHEPADLDLSIASIERILQQVPESWPWIPVHLVNGAQALLERYERDQELRDLELAIHSAEQAITLALPNELGMGPYHGTWARTLQAMATAVNDAWYWASAADAFGQAAANLPEWSERRLRYLDDLSVCQLQARRVPALRTRPPGILGFNQVELARMMEQDEGLAERVTIVPKNSMQLPDDELPEGADDAIEQLRSSRDAYETGTQAWVVATLNLAGMLIARASLGAPGAVDDEDAAWLLADETLAQTAPIGTERMGAHHHKAEVGRLRLRRGADAAIIAEATEEFSTAVDIAERVLDTRGIGIARSWGDWAAERSAWPEAARAYDAALRLQQHFVAREPSRAYAEQRLSLDTASARAAALAHFHAGDPARAALSIESGRAQLLAASLLRMWTDVESLRASGEGDLAARYEAARTRLDALDRTQAIDDDIVLTEWNARYTEARTRFDAVVEEIRSRPGQSTFLRPIGPSDIHRAVVAAGAPLVYLVPGPGGGCALIVRESQVSGLPLDDLQDADVRTHAAAVLSGEDGAGLSAAVDAAGEWLWNTVAAPLLAELRGEPEIVVVAAGLLSMLPIHAAQRPDPSAPTGRRYLSDEVGVRYAPNARALLSPPRASRERVTLAVADPEPIDAEPLPGAAAELALVAAADPRHTISLSGTDATRASVLRHLPDVARLHVASHAVAEVDDPLRSGLVLAGDERLTLRDLLATRVDLELAVLSACETAVSGGALPDEVMNLASALLQAGARTVVATQWRVSDIATLLLIALFMRELSAGATAAGALHTAQRTLRDSTNAELAAFASDYPHLRGSRRILQLADPCSRDHADPSIWAGFMVVGR